MTGVATPSQTVGPFFGIGLPWERGPFVVADGTEGAFWIRGTVFDGAGAPVPDAVVETWQADPAGRYPRAGAPIDGWSGFGRACTDEAGGWGVLTVMPGTSAALAAPAGAADAPGGGREAPHLAVAVFARGLLKHAVTRIYFADRTADNGRDPVLARVPAARRDTLLATPAQDGYRFDIHLQGPGETVFFAV